MSKRVRRFLRRGSNRRRDSLSFRAPRLTESHVLCVSGGARTGVCVHRGCLSPPGRDRAATCGLQVHRARFLNIKRRLRPFEHLRQLYDSWCCTRLGSRQWTVVLFLELPCSPDVPYRSQVRGENLDFDANDLLHLQLLEHAVEQTILRPLVYLHVDRVPTTESLRQTVPPATRFADKKKRILVVSGKQGWIATVITAESVGPRAALNYAFSASKGAIRLDPYASHKHYYASLTQRSS
jgi:hypothetical protein